MTLKHTLVALGALSFSVAALANVKLYQEAKPSSKVVATLDNTQNLIPIYQSKGQHDWIKVADTSTGQVGWLQLHTKTKTTVTKDGKQYIEHVVTTDNGVPHSYRVIEYRGDKKLSKEQVQKMVQRMDQQNLQMQRHMDQMMNNMLNGFDQFSMMPFVTQPTVIIMPVETAPAAQPAKK